MSDFTRDAYEMAKSGNKGLDELVNQDVQKSSHSPYSPVPQQHDDAFATSARQPSKGGSDGRRLFAASMKGDNWKVTIVKATSKDQVGPPKAKHVRAIVDGLQKGGSFSDRSSSVGSIVYHLRKRLQEPEWLVIVKTLSVFHHIFREGNPKFVEYFSNKARDTIKLTDWNGFGQSSLYAPFIRSYSDYLYQWCEMRAKIRFPPGRVDDDVSFATRHYSGMSSKGVFRDLPVLAETLEKLIAIKLDSAITVSPAGAPALYMIIKDVTYLWVAVTQATLSLIDKFFEMEVGPARISYGLYEQHLSLVPNVRKFFEKLNGLNLNKQLPEVGVVTNELSSSMREYIDNANALEQDVNYSDEELPEPYYEPPDDYFSESDPEPEYRPPPRPKTPSTSSSEEEEEEEEEEEPIPQPIPQPIPTMVPQQRAFDPLVDLLGMQQMTMAGAPITQYQQPVYQQPGFQNTGDTRVQSIKAVMNGVQQQRVMAAQGANVNYQALSMPASTAVQTQGAAMGSAGRGGGLSNVYAQMQAAQVYRNQTAQAQGMPGVPVQQATVQQGQPALLMNQAYVTQQQAQQMVSFQGVCSTSLTAELLNLRSLELVSLSCIYCTDFLSLAL
mmetsp:Transcript_27548/g.107918  ORF Transcript_27548/g.107918 Transcript_27548/m.107918 type:complete len:611 (-) Transcript_27548:1594-3426(-)